MKVQFNVGVGGFQKGDTVELPNSLVSQDVLNQWLENGKVKEVKAVKVAKKPKQKSRKSIKASSTK